MSRLGATNIQDLLRKTQNIRLFYTLISPKMVSLLSSYLPFYRLTVNYFKNIIAFLLATFK